MLRDEFPRPHHRKSVVARNLHVGLVRAHRVRYQQSSEITVTEAGSLLSAGTRFRDWIVAGRDAELSAIWIACVFFKRMQPTGTKYARSASGGP
jgi:hypothetical protein